MTGATGALANGDDAFVVPIPGLTLSNISFADSSAVTLNSLTISAAITVGMNDTTSGNFFGHWKIGATTLNLTTADGSSSTGPTRVKINLGSVASTINVFQTSGSPADTGAEPVRLIGTSASNVLNVMAGTVGIATGLPGDAANLSGGINVVGGTVNLAAGVTWATANVASGAALNTNSGGTTLSLANGGTATTKGNAAITTVNTSGTANLRHRPATMCTTVNVYSNGVADFSGNGASSTVTNLNQYANAKVIVNAANPSHITFTNRTTILCGTLTATS